MSYDIISFGSNTVDNFVYSDSKLIEIKAPHLSTSLLAYPYGSKVIINDFNIEIGGGGTNTAVAFSRLGLKTGYVGVLGKDENALKVINLLKKEKVDFLGKLKEYPTGFSIILDSFEKDRTILTYKGANDQLEYKDINFSKLDTKWFYFSSLTNKSFQTTLKLFEYAKKNKINVAFNPSSYQVENMSLDDLKNVDVLIFNKEEAQILLRSKLQIEHTLDDMFKILSKYVNLVVITNGRVGAYLYSKKDNTKLFVKARKTKIVEATGAGDSFASTFIYSLIKNYSYTKAFKLASLNAESVIRYKGAKNKLLTQKEILKKYEKAKFLVKKVDDFSKL